MRIVRRPLFPGEFDHELVWLFVSVAALAGAAAWLRLGLPWPHCPFLEMTGYPCLSCGATRCAIAFGRGHFVDGLGWNPLVALALLGLAAFDLYAVLVLVFRLPRLRAVEWRGWEKNAVRIAVIVLLAVNWIYLLSHRSQF